MSRQQRSKNQVLEIAERFNTLVQTYLGCTYPDLSKLLEYANPSTLYAVKYGRTLPDFIRIAEHIDRLRDRRGRKINLHWLITGDGSPMLNNKNSKSKNNYDDIIINVGDLDREKREAVLGEIAKLLAP